MKGVKNKILSALVFAFFIVPCMFVVTACSGEEHKAVEKWSTDETYHWHTCAVEGCKVEEHIFDKAKHDFEWVITKDATCSELGKQHGECKVCGYKTEDEVIATKDHTYTKYEMDDTQHWQKCEECDHVTPKTDHSYDKTKNDGKICTVCEYINGEATIGTGDTMVVYDTLTSAVSSASANDTIVLVKDVNLGNGNLTFDKKVTLDLNGKSLIGNGATGVLHVIKNGDLTITGNGSVVAIAGTDTTVGATGTATVWAMAVWAEGGKVTIVNGTFSNQTCEGQNIGQGKSESNTQTKDNLDLIYAKDDGETRAEIVIEDGTFNCVQTMWTLNIHNSSQSTITVKGGTFIGYDPANGDNNGEEGGAPNGTFVGSNYESKQIGTTGSYIVVPKTTPAE